MNHDFGSSIGRCPSLCVCFFVSVKGAAIVARLQFRIAIEIGERRKVADDFSLTVILRLPSDAGDVDACRYCWPIAPPDAPQPLDKEPPFACSGRNDPSSQDKWETVPIVDCSTHDHAGCRLTQCHTRFAELNRLSHRMKRWPAHNVPIESLGWGTGGIGIALPLTGDYKLMNVFHAVLPKS